MSDNPQANAAFSANYTKANLPANAVPYDKELFLSLVANLSETNPRTAPAILSVILCGHRRGDCVPELWRDLTADASDEDALETFRVIKAAITATFTFIGAPHCVPAALGLVHELRRRDIQVADTDTRAPLDSGGWAEKGAEVRKVIYRGVGNPEVHMMISRYFPEWTEASTTTVFGYLIGGSLHQQTIAEAELFIAAAVTSIGATRQTKSHLKASLGVGNSIKAVETMVAVAGQVADWNHSARPETFDVQKLAKEVEENLAPENHS